MLLLSLSACSQYKEWQLIEINDLLSKEKYHEVLPIIKKELSKDSTDLLLLQAGVEAYTMTASFNNAIFLAKKMIEIDSNNNYAYTFASLNYYSKKNYDSALIFVNRAIDNKTAGRFVIHKNPEIYPFDENILYLKFLRATYNTDGKTNLKQVKLDIDELFEKNYDPMEMTLLRGNFYGTIGKLDEACVDFKEAKKLGNPDADWYIDRYCKNQQLNEN
ncbi:MAG: hypothetical protein KA275_08560 [Chitinophagaceae bacterium]|nr:hypothetical protein [Chitinophagaceae bacterium]